MSRSNRDIGQGNGRGAHVFDLIPAYIDDMLKGDERELVRAHLDACPECHADYLELTATRQMLRSVPVVVPPRAFTLTEEMVAQTRAQTRRRSLLDVLFSPGNTPRFATGAILSFALLLLILSSNVLIGSTINNTFTRIGSGLGDSYGSSEAAAPAPNKSAEEYANVNIAASPTPAAMAAGAPSMDMPVGTPVPETASGAMPGEPPIQAQVTQLPARGSVAAQPTVAAGAEGGTGGGTDTSSIVTQAQPTPAPGEDLFAFDSAGNMTATSQWRNHFMTGTGSIAQENRDASPLDSYTPPSTPFPTFEAALFLLGLLMVVAAFLSRRR